MSYNMQEFSKRLHTAGKITVLTSLIGVMVFAVIFLLNIGAQEFQQVQAQGIATTTLTVLNTPPSWTVDAQEGTESSTSTPTNTDSDTTWVATATDSNSAPYFLLICSDGTAPTANAAANPGSLGTAPPTCDVGATQWAVSASTTSGAQATATRTALDGDAESNTWFAWVCDDDPTLPRCNAVSKQGTGTTSSPFNVNHRPSFTLYSDDSGKLPGETVTWTATSTDADVVDAADTMQLHVCSTASFTGGSCDATTLATSSFGTGVQTAAYIVPVPTQDQNYGAFGYIIDVHGHEATGGQQGVDSVLTVDNAPPFSLGGDITLENGGDLVLTLPAGETTGFSLDFLASDNNSCENAAAGDEITGYELSVFRTDITHNACDTLGDYDANNCYTSTVATTTWNIACTASSTTCTGSTDLTMLYECTFPLWYIADPTSGAVPHAATNWSAAVAPVDDNNATGTMATGTAPQDLLALTAFELDTNAIPYGPLEPGDRTDPLVATTTMRSTGNTGIDQMLSGESMCGTYTSAVSCPNSASSTIDANYQVFATSSVTYGSASSSGFILSSTTPVELEVNIQKSTSTVTQASGETFWGIEVPIAITLAGAYTGENTFTVVTSEPGEW